MSDTMKRFEITDTIIAEVNYRYHIDAATPEEAREIWQEDAGSYLVGFDVGDCINYPTPPITISEITDTSIADKINELNK